MLFLINFHTRWDLDCNQIFSWISRPVITIHPQSESSASSSSSSWLFWLLVQVLISKYFIFTSHWLSLSCHIKIHPFISFITTPYSQSGMWHCWNPFHQSTKKHGYTPVSGDMLHLLTHSHRGAAWSLPSVWCGFFVVYRRKLDSWNLGRHTGIIQAPFHKIWNQTKTHEGAPLDNSSSDGWSESMHQ